MLYGRVAVFLSCSERHKKRVAFPIRSALAEHGIHGIIVSDEPLLPGATGEPESKVDTYLEASDAFLALCTPDNELDDGTVQTRQNIIDEHARARSRPKLRERIQVFKDPTVKLPSNINPAYEALDIDDVSPISELILRQLRTWDLIGVVPKRARPLSSKPPPTVPELIDGLELGAHEEATRRAYELLRRKGREAAEATVEELRRFLRAQLPADNDATLCAGSVLEAINRLDPSLVSIELIEELSGSDDLTKRSIAAMLLWDRAEVAPGEVPLALLGRLALPSTEDWYVQAPAMAAVKQLLLRRWPARIILDRLAESEDPVDRYAVAAALLDIAQVDRWVAPRDLVVKLAEDGDGQVAAKGREALAVIADRPEGERDPRRPFGL